MELHHCPKTMKKKSSHTLVLDNLILLITVDLEFDSFTQVQSNCCKDS